MGRPSHRLPSKSRPATHGSSLLDLDPPTKRFAWMRLDQSSALTLEPMKNTITDLSTNSSPLAALVRPDLVPKKLTSVLQPQSAKMGGWACPSLSRIMEDSFVCLPYDASLISKRFGLTPLCKCLRVSLPVSSSDIFLSSTIPLASFNSGLAGRGLHASRTPNSSHYQLPKRVKKIGIMIPSLWSGGYRSYFNSLSPSPLKTELIHVQIKELW
ncbi:unnamed protein product [Arabidopsis halleri]